MTPRHVVVLGGTGFVGSRLVPRLQRDGHTITVLSRNRERHRELGVLPRVMVRNADVHDRTALARHLDGADAAINLVGILNERGSDGSGFRKVHARDDGSGRPGCRRCARAGRTRGADTRSRRTAPRRIRAKR